MKKELKRESFVNRKRPAVEGAAEDLLGPAAQLDEIISGNPLPDNFQTENENQENFKLHSKNEPG